MAVCGVATVTELICRKFFSQVLGNCVFIGPYFTELKRTILNKVNEISGDCSQGKMLYTE